MTAYLLLYLWEARPQKELFVGIWAVVIVVVVYVVIANIDNPLTI